MGRLADIVRQDRTGPLAVLIHVPLPHSPFGFDSHCGKRPIDADSLGSPGREEHAGYAEMEALVIDQTRCVDALVLDGLADIVEQDPTGIIVVFWDRGPKSGSIGGIRRRPPRT